MIPAASICLLDRARRRVLLGRRRTAPSRGAWAFPGGRTLPGEAPLDAALRELREETGIGLRDIHVTGTHTVRVADFEITCVVAEVAEPAEPTPGPELDARWVDLEDVPSLRPMTRGTRQVLREVA